MRAAVLVPHHGDVKAKFSASLARLAAATKSAELEFFYEEDGPLELKRTRLALRGRQWGASHLLWIDTDQTFPPDALDRLLAHDKPIIGCNIPTRHDPVQPTAIDDYGRRTPTTQALAEAEALVEVGAIGLGFCLMKAEIFDRIAAPWFESRISPEGELLCGEDVHFCNMAWRAGIAVWVDHSLSWQVGHVAEVVRHNSDVKEAGPLRTVFPMAGSR